MSDLQCFGVWNYVKFHLQYREDEALPVKIKHFQMNVIFHFLKLLSMERLEP